MRRLICIATNASDANQFEGIADKLQMPFDLLVFEETGVLTSAEKVFLASRTEQVTADGLDKALAKLGRDYSHLAAVSSMAAKDLLPRIAAHLDAAMITDAIDVLSDNTFKRNMQAGSIVATVQTNSDRVVLTFRPSAFPKSAGARSPIIQEISLENSPKSEVLGSSGSATKRPDLAQAKFVISGGRPLKDAQTFEKVIGGFADAFGGAVGATRAAVDSGIAPNENQVGQTGKIVAPDLYVAAGISGSTQHVAGIKDSKLIVAINKDPDAPIFEVADLGFVGDLFDVLPELERELKKS